MMQGTVDTVVGLSGSDNAADDGGVLDAFEARAAVSKQARRWAIGSGSLVMLLGLVAMFHYSAAAAVETAKAASLNAAETRGFQVACMLFVSAVLMAITAGRVCYSWVSARALPEAMRSAATQVTVAAMVAAAAAVGFTMLTFAVSFGFEVARLQAASFSGELSSWELSRLPQLGFFEGMVASGLGALAAALMLRASGEASLSDGSGSPASKRRALAVGGGLAAMFAVAIVGQYVAAAMDFEDVSAPLSLLLGGLVGGLVMLLMRPRTGMRGVDMEVQRAAADDEMVQDALRAMRRATQQRWLARLLAAVAGMLTVAVGIYLADLASASLPYDEQPGLRTFFGIIALGVVAMLMVNKRLAPQLTLDDGLVGENLASTGGMFDETLATTSGLTVRQQHTLGNIFFGDGAGQQFELVDGGGAWCGSAKEESSLLARLVLRGRRPLDIVVDDLGETALKVSRPTVLWSERASVHVGERRVGEITRRWSPLRRVYRVRDAEGRDSFLLVSGWWFHSRFGVMKDGVQVGELRRLRKPWYRRLFASSLMPEQDRFALTFPPQADMDQRRLLLSALFLVDASA